MFSGLTSCRLKWVNIIRASDFPADASRGAALHAKWVKEKLLEQPLIAEMLGRL